jgi:hypothetical protein
MPVTADGGAVESLVAVAAATSDAEARSIGDPKVFGFARMRDLLGWSQDTTHRVTGSLAYSETITCAGVGCPPSPPPSVRAVDSLSVPRRVVRLWNDVRRQRGGEGEGDEAEQADDPERVRPGGLGDCQ